MTVVALWGPLRLCGTTGRRRELSSGPRYPRNALHISTHGRRRVSRRGREYKEGAREKPGAQDPFDGDGWEMGCAAAA